MRFNFKWSYAWSLLALVLALQCTLLSLQNRKLVEVAKALKARTEATTIAVGAPLTRLNVQSAAGASTQLDLEAGDPTALLFFSRDCAACQHAMELWKPWVAGLPSDVASRVIPVEVDPVDLATMPQIGTSVATLGTSRESVREVIVAFPTTVLVDGQGKVAGTWRGAPSELGIEELDAQIRALFSPDESDFAHLLAKSRN